ncbi:hypothetical protein HYH03_007884 [Edaphochlamys debaryana]|uniref:Uncharacterized protein n=1 Tax=Edaphochlamys debaryana TaxID=47281 RepID=A0A835YAG6_9CHLO|nr:hypothetical protein HYH03_007884 [Edaphochlamys debaryana]|eukprot:KAG2493954.1 hypothetical protein HYH03_007884 [Edaphochlamys debaryana]
MSKPAPGAEPELDPAKLAADPEKIKILMRRDPKFITRLISELDKSMHKVLREKAKRKQEIEDAEKEIEKIDEEIKTHITPNVARLESAIASKSALREHLKQQCDSEFNKVKNLEAEARALIQKSRHTAGKLMRNTAQQRLEEARGFNTSQPTTALLAASGKKPAKPPG